VTAGFAARSRAVIVCSSADRRRSKTALRRQLNPGAAFDLGQPAREARIRFVGARIREIAPSALQERRFL
jgi:hypothetical protein